MEKKKNIYILHILSRKTTHSKLQKIRNLVYCTNSVQTLNATWSSQEIFLFTVLLDPFPTFLQTDNLMSLCSSSLMHLSVFLFGSSIFVGSVLPSNSSSSLCMVWHQNRFKLWAYLLEWNMTRSRTHHLNTASAIELPRFGSSRKTEL